MTIALIAHDSKKELMVQFCTAYCRILSQHKLVATGTTGKLISEATGLQVQRFLAGVQGGDQQIASRIACNEIDLLLFFRDPINAKPSEPNEMTLLRLCDVHNIPLATNIATNIREIEGAYNKIVAYTSLMHMPITVETAQKVLSDMGNDIKTRTITYEGIIKVVADHYNVKQDELFNKKRTQNIAFPRQVAMYLCRELADLSYPRIGELFGGRDHTTVIHAYEKISNFKNSNLAFQNELQEIIEILRQ